MTTDSAGTLRKPYRFKDHVPALNPIGHWVYGMHCPRHQPRDQRPSAKLPKFGEVIDAECLVPVFRELSQHNGQAPGLDGLRYDDLSITEAGSLLRAASQAIGIGTYRPQPARSVWILKSDGVRRRELQVRSIIDRIVSSAVTKAITAVIDPLLLPCSYGFRPRRCVHLMLATMERMMITTDRWIVAQDDVRDAFGSVLISEAIEDFQRVLTAAQHADLLGPTGPNGQPALINLISVILRGDDPERERGIDQGDPISPLTLNLLLHHVLDLPHFGAAGPGNPLLFRYADNLVYVCHSVPQGQQALNQARQLLEPHQLFLKGGASPVNLRRQGSRVEILGIHLWMQDDRVRFGIPKGAWQHLGETLEEAHGTPDPTEAARTAISGWLGFFGPALESKEDRKGITQRLCSCLVRTGHHELGPYRWLEGRMRDALGHWHGVRDQVHGTGGSVGDSSYTAPPRVSQPVDFTGESAPHGARAPWEG